MHIKNKREASKFKSYSLLQLLWIDIEGPRNHLLYINLPIWKK
jgi:hypothetical protein